LDTELPDCIALKFRNRTAELAAVFVVTVGMVYSNNLSGQKLRGRLLANPA
jgi:hypothetical protein